MTFLNRIAGWKKHSAPGSNSRRAFTRLSWFLSFVYLTFAILNLDIQPDALTYYAWFMLIYAVMIFGWVVLFPTLLSDTEFVVDAKRLLADTVSSALLTISAFALIHQVYGLNPPDHQTGDIVNLDYTYFSAVTFSTLGYGDFTPLQFTRVFAAIEALLGNIHLGFVVGTIFVLVNDARSRKYQTEKQGTQSAHRRNAQDDGH